MNPKIDYSQSTLKSSKIAYDLSLIYAKSKFEQKLRENYDFDKGPAPAEIEELEALNSHFLFALEYFSSMDTGDVEKAMAKFKDGTLIP